MDNFIVFETNEITNDEPDVSLYKNRKALASYNIRKFKSEVTIWFLAYNNIEKTKRSIKSIQKHTQNIDYDILLIDNGSTDDTLDYFKSVPFEKKTIIHITENKGAGFPSCLLGLNLFSPYLVIVLNDIIVTQNWLSNLLEIIKSDPKTGMVCPMSSNTSNLQDPMLTVSDYSDIDEVANLFNVSDPRKWRERLRLMTLVTLYSKDCLYATGWPNGDVGFAHNFADDDITFRVRRAGYKAILAGDTWVHHDDHKKNLTFEQAKKINDDLKIGRENFKEKYFGIDAWDDVNNYIPEYLGALKASNDVKSASILGVDVKCGTPVLEIKNELRKHDIFDAQCSAYTTDAKYVIDLQTVCGASNVYSGSINGFSESFEKNSFDFVVIGNDINTYSDPFRVIRSAYSLLKPDGQLFFSLQNTNNIFNFAYSIGRTHIRDKAHAINYTVEELLSQLMQSGYNAEYISARGFDKGAISQDLLSNISSCLEVLPINDKNETMFRLTSQHYYFVINASA